MDAAAAVVMANGCDIGRHPDDLCQLEGVIESPHAGAAEEGRDENTAGLAPQLMPMLDFPDPLEFLECRIELRVVRSDRHIEHATAKGPVTLIPFRCRSIGEAKCVARIVE